MNCDSTPAAHLYDSTAIRWASVGSALMISGVRAFVDQNAVGLVDQDEVGRSLDRLVAADIAGVAEHAAEKIGLSFADAALEQPVAKKVETEFLGRAVGDVAGVGFAPLPCCIFDSMTPTVRPSASKIGRICLASRPAR